MTATKMDASGNSAASGSPFDWRGLSALSLLVVLGGAAVAYLEDFAALAIGWLALERQSAAGEATYFFIYETPKVLLLLAGIVFVVGVVQTFFAPARTRDLLAGCRAGIGTLAAAGLGIVTPFCSCSAVPLFIGLLSAGVPLGVTFSFLVAAPMVNEIALALLFALFGWKVAALYLGLGLLVAVFSGLVIGRLRMERYLEDWVRQAVRAPDSRSETLSWKQRLDTGRRHALNIVGKVWPYVAAGIAVGAGIHGYVPEDLMASFMGKDVWWAVPAAVLLGIPMYAGAAGIVPIVQALIAKGAALGTVLAFMMSVIALSAPEMIILRKALKARLIATFTVVVASGILLVGFIFNAVL